MNGEFNPEYSTNSIFYDTNMNECLTIHIEGIESDISDLQSGKANINHIHTDYASINHTHSYNDLTDKPTIPVIPTSLPANGGNADTLDGKHASDFSMATHKHSASDITNGTLPISKGGTGANTVSGALANFGNIGKVYSSTPGDKYVAKMSMVTIASLTLPAGVYVITGNHQWEVNGIGCMYISRITKSDDSAVYCIVRSDMIGGGGATAAAIVELAETTTIKYETYHQYTTATNAEAIRFSAVKIR